jgi:hypothetical protein
MFLSNQEKKQCSPMPAMWIEILSEWVFNFHGLSSNVGLIEEKQWMKIRILLQKLFQFIDNHVWKPR